MKPVASRLSTLSVYLRQRATIGASHASPGVINGIRDARDNIRRIKQILREWNVPVVDHPDDEEPLVSSPKPVPKEGHIPGGSTFQTGDQSINIGVGHLPQAHIHDIHIGTAVPKERVAIQRVSHGRLAIVGTIPTTGWLLAIGGIGTVICLVAFFSALTNISSISSLNAVNFWLYLGIAFALLFVVGLYLRIIRFVHFPWLNLTIETDNNGRLYTTKVQGICPRCGSTVRLRRVGAKGEKVTKLVCRRNPFQHVWEFDPTELPDIERETL